MPARNRPVKRSRRLKNPKVLVFGFLLVAALALVLGAGVRLVQGYDNRLWDDDLQSQITLVVVSNPPVIVSYKSDTREVIIIPLPQNLEVVATGGMGNWRTESLYDLGIEKGVGGELLRRTLENAFGLPVDGWIDARALEWLGYANPRSVRENKPSLTFVPKNILSALWPGETRLTVFDTVRLATGLGIASHKRVVMPEEAGLIQRVQLASGELGWKVVNDVGQTAIAPDFIDHGIAQERAAVGIINATRSTGLGRRVATIVENMGAQVIWLNSEGKFDGRCGVGYGQRAGQIRTARRLARLLNCSLEQLSWLSPAIQLKLGQEIATDFPPLVF